MEGEEMKTGWYWCDLCEEWKEGDPDYEDLPSGTNTINICGSCALDFHVRKQAEESRKAGFQ